MSYEMLNNVTLPSNILDISRLTLLSFHGDSRPALQSTKLHHACLGDVMCTVEQSQLMCNMEPVNVLRAFLVCELLL